MTTSRTWSAAGVVAGVAGLATSYFVAMALTIRESPVVAIADLVIRHAPGFAAERAIQWLGSSAKPLLLAVEVLVALLAFAWAGRLARRRWWAPVAVFAVLAALGSYAVLEQRGAQAIDVVPVAVGLVTWLVVFSLMTGPIHHPPPGGEREASGSPDAGGEQTRRTFLLRAGIVAAGSVVLGVAGRGIGRGRRHVEETRRLLRLPGVTPPAAPRAVRIGVPGVTPWVTPNDDFYRIHTAFAVPTIEPAEWSLRIHGMVEREVVIGYDALLARRLTEAWVTLSCVSNEVGGSLVGNAWWSGVPVADLLAEAGVRPGADCVLQTSYDGWTCSTPLEALTDGRDALLAVAMNGRPLPIDHGFPVRTIVPGLFGYVSATKWVVEMEVTRFEDVEAYWTARGWDEHGPVRTTSRIDVPRGGAEVPAGELVVAGVAWSQHTGISAVEVSVDGGAWLPAELAATPSVDTWVQWAVPVDVAEGEHELRVRAIDREGRVQSGVEAPPIPSGATGWHTVGFSAV